MTSTNPSPVSRPVGVLYEHPEWFNPLFSELDTRGIPYTPIDASTLVWDPAVTDLDYSVVINRMSPSAWLRGNSSTIQSTANYLDYLEGVGVPVINGSKAYAFEISKARQLRLLNELGVAHPKGRVVADAGHAVRAAKGLRYPVLIKPNVGGSGAGIVSFDTPESLDAAATAGELDFGPDDTALVQEHLTAQDDAIVRVEFLGGEFLYGIRLRLTPGTFNLCPADYCDIVATPDASAIRAPIEAFKPSPDIIRDAKRLLDATGADLGGVEYLINEATGEATFYDINALSNFVADAPTIIGFDPFVDLVDYITKRAGIDGQALASSW
ncbi:MAG: ATP-grasp domain-containing protein [Acidimicrobiia bacterium]